MQLARCPTHFAHATEAATILAAIPGADLRRGWPRERPLEEPRWGGRDRHNWIVPTTKDLERESPAPKWSRPDPGR